MTKVSLFRIRNYLMIAHNAGEALWAYRRDTGSPAGLDETIHPMTAGNVTVLLHEPPLPGLPSGAIVTATVSAAELLAHYNVGPHRDVAATGSFMLYDQEAMKYNTETLIDGNEIRQILEQHLAADTCASDIDNATSALLQMLLDSEGERVQRDERYQKMYAVAKEYYRLLEKAGGASPCKKAELKQELDRLTAPFSDNVAYHAFLEMERMAALGED